MFFVMVFATVLPVCECQFILNKVKKKNNCNGISEQPEKCCQIVAVIFWWRRSCKGDIDESFLLNSETSLRRRSQFASSESSPAAPSVEPHPEAWSIRLLSGQADTKLDHQTPFQASKEDRVLNSRGTFIFIFYTTEM